MGDCRRHTMEAVRAMRTFLKHWKGPSEPGAHLASHEERLASTAPREEPEAREDSRAPESGAVEHLEGKVKELEEALRKLKHQCHQLQTSICSAFNPTMVENDEEDDEEEASVGEDPQSVEDSDDDEDDDEDEADDPAPTVADQPVVEQTAKRPMRYTGPDRKTSRGATDADKESTRAAPRP